MAWTLCSKADVLSITPTTENALSDLWSDSVEAMIRRHMGMPHLGKQVVIENEYHDGDGTNILIVKRPPIISVASVYINGALIGAEDYVVGGSSIQLKYTKFLSGLLNVQVSYTSGSVVDPGTGVSSIDPIVRLTAASMITAILNYKNRAGSDSSIMWGGASTAEGESTPNVRVGLTSHLETILKRMLRREHVRVS